MDSKEIIYFLETEILLEMLVIKCVNFIGLTIMKAVKRGQTYSGMTRKRSSERYRHR